MQILLSQICKLPLNSLIGSEGQIKAAIKIREEAIALQMGEWEGEKEDQAFLDIINSHEEAAWWISKGTQARGSKLESWRAFLFDDVNALLIERYPNEYE